ncbi:TLD-domain-containing protein [Dipodascopsis tothii]|uniref:TLD-domain-containing protein n=1 Tax=Dipodascopsis tothii TaxID=44089 RepID=UPI0034CF74F0
MGQLPSSESSSQTVTPAEVSARFAVRCGQLFTGIELWAFKDVFRRSAKVNDGVLYWTEEDVAKFFMVPEHSKEAGKILYEMSCFLATFPFIRERSPPLAVFQTAPTTLTFENMVKVVVLLTGRYKSLIVGDYDFLKLLFLALAHYEKRKDEEQALREKQEAIRTGAVEEDAPAEPEKVAEPEKAAAAEDDVGFWERKFSQLADKFDKLPFVGDDDERPSTSGSGSAEETLDVNLDRMSSWYDLELVKGFDRVAVDGVTVSPTTIYHLLVFVMAIGPLSGEDPIDTYAEHFSAANHAKYQQLAANMTRSFYPQWAGAKKTAVEEGPHERLTFDRFQKVIRGAMPFAFDGLAVLFEHFLFNNRRTVIPAAAEPEPETEPEPESDAESDAEPAETVLVKKAPAERLPAPSRLMNPRTVAQLSTFMDTNSFRLYGGLRKLYVGSEAGFSMGSLELKVFKWNAPTIVLISGYILPAEPRGARERAFSEMLPPSRFRSSLSQVRGTGKHVIYGAVLNAPWKLSNRECFGDNATALFQLEPVHDVFRAARYNNHYAYFSRLLGVGFGSTPPKQNTHTNNGLPQYAFGDVSLTIEHALEFGIFRHIGSETFRASQVREHAEFEDRFEITELEVWGCGADEQVREQAALWAWEEREANLRKGVNLPKDIEESRALLEMAGLVGGGGSRSGGSI